MKIDRSDIVADALDRVGKPATTVRNRDTKGLATTPATDDEARLSSEAELIQNGQQSPNVRQDVVERMRAALANGEVGNDPHALADAIIDRLIGTPRNQS